MANIQWNSVGSGVLRDNAYQLNNATGAYERITLLEMAATNLVLQSDALATTWQVGAGTPLPTNAVGTYANRPFSRLAYTTGWTTDYLKQNVTFTGDGVKAFSILAKQDGSNAGTFVINLCDLTVLANRLTITLTVAAGGAISGVCSSGATLLKTVALADGVYRFDCQSVSVTAANTNQIQLGLSPGNVPSILLSGVQASDNLVPSSLIPTTTATVTRAADGAYLDLAGTALAVPREMTLYLTWIELGTALLANRIFQIGNLSTGASLILFGTSSGYQASFYNGGTHADPSRPAQPALNDQVEYRIYVAPDGTLTRGQSINGGAESVATGAAGPGIPAAWGVDTKLWLNSSQLLTNFGLLGLQAFKALPGNYTLAQMRAI